ncbi:ArsR/SmtB family transcription factor [Streptomyces sp. NPDC002004]
MSHDSEPAHAPEVTADSAPRPRPTRRIDVRSLRGLAHPLRMRILDMLGLDGPATATQLSERLGENTGTVSWHLRNLAEHGFIVEEKERGTRRERWWKRAGVTNELNIADFRDEPDSQGALSVYLNELVRQYFERTLRYLGEDWPDEWRAAGTVSEWRDLRLTPHQLAALNAELMAVIARHTPPADTAPDPGALPVVVQLQSYPRGERGIS